MATVTWETAADWDNAQSEDGVVHESVTNTDHNDATIVKQGYALANPYLEANVSAFWPLHENSGSTAFDIDGSNDLTVSGATQGVTGILGTTAYDFDGTDDDAVGSHIPGLLGGDPFSIMTWFNPDAVGRQPIVLNYAADNDRWVLGVTSDGNFALRVTDAGTAHDAVSGVSLSTNTWYLGIGTYDGAGNPTVYLNATAYTNALGGSESPPNNENTTQGFAIGNTISFDSGFDGSACHVVAFNKELSASEVQTLLDVVATPGSLVTAPKTVS